VFEALTWSGQIASRIYIKLQSSKEIAIACEARNQAVRALIGIDSCVYHTALALWQLLVYGV
jgi:hypothetical protein